MYTVVNNYKEYYSINKLKLNLVKANNETKRNKGLMFRKNPLKENEGMLFKYKKPQKISMWMKNTYIPLDLLFLDKNLRVVEMKTNLKPLNTKKKYTSEGKYKYAIELNKNSINKFNIKKGTLIIPNYIDKFEK